MSTSHLTIVDAIKAEIADKPQGAKLDSEVKLSARFGAARETVRRALAVLEEEGRIFTQHGRGRFVGSSAPAALPPDLARIHDQLVAQLDAGTPAPKERFLSEAELGTEFGLTRHDARRILIALEQAGRLVVVPGKGRFVAGEAEA